MPDLPLSCANEESQSFRLLVLFYLHAKNTPARNEESTKFNETEDAEDLSGVSVSPVILAGGVSPVILAGGVSPVSLTGGVSPVTLAGGGLQYTH